VPLVVIDLQTYDVLYTNPASEQVYPSMDSEMYADGFRDWISLLSDSEQSRLHERLRQHREGALLPATEYHARLPDGSPLDLTVQAVVTTYLERPALLTAVYDTTEQHRALRAEAEERRFNEALLDIAAAINSTLHFDDVLVKIFANLSRVVSHDWANLMLIREGYTHVVGTHAYPPEAAAAICRTRFPMGELVTFRQMIATHKPVIINDVETVESWRQQLPIPEIRAYLGAPIVRNDEVIGFINLDSQRVNAFRPRDGERLQAFADQIAIAIQNAQTFERAREDAMAQERQRLARELHDSVSQLLFSASVTAEALPLLLRHSPEASEEALKQVARLTKGALAEMRTLLVELRPNTMAEIDLSILLSYLVGSLQTHTGAVVDYQVHGQSYDLPPEVKIALYRIAQEALTNIVKHAGARHVEFMLTFTEFGVAMTIEDDGAGFAPEQVRPEHLGLRIMRERADNTGVLLRICAARQTGTRIEARWGDIPDSGHDHFCL
jgi:signal transduction histidine kinase